MPDLLTRLQDALAGRYRVERELGHGGMATVYLTHDPRHDRQVAIKVLRPELAALLGPDRFLREIATTARLTHPGILPLFDSGTDQGISWYAMPLITGKTLRDRLAEAGPLPLDEALRIFADVAGALDYAHRQGVLHRDLKPANILLQEERALLADFGIALPVGGAATRLTETGFSLGTPEYMSPEQAAAERALDARSDIYALGCVLYEMLAGEPPYTGPTAQAVLAKRFREPVPRISTLREVPPSLERAVSRALAREPADRFATVAAFAEAVAGETSGAATRPVTAFRTRSRQVGLVALLAAVLAALLGARWLMGRGRAPGDAPASRTARERPANVDAEAYNLYVQGRSQLQRRTQVGLTSAVSLFREAIHRDTAFALAWAGLANSLEWARTWHYTVPGVPADSLLARELEASDRAIALDSASVDMWLLRAGVASAIDPTSTGPAIHALRHALALDSLNPKGWAMLGWALEHMDRDSAVRAMRRSVALGRNPVALANHFYWGREFDSAAIWADSAVVMDPRLPWARETVGAVALERGRLDEAEAAYEAARRLDTGPTAVRSLEGLAEVAARRGDTARARALIRQAEAITNPARPSEHAAISLGSAYAAVGDPAHALMWLERYQPRGALHFQLHLRRDPQLDPLRGLTRFEALLSR